MTSKIPGICSRSKLLDLLIVLSLLVAFSKQINAFENHFAAGMISFNNQEYKQAVKNFSMAVWEDPEDAEARTMIGLSWFALKKYKKSVAVYTELLDYDPANATAYLNRGTCHYHMNRKERAIDDFSRAIAFLEKKTNSVASKRLLSDAYYNRAVTYELVYEDTAKAMADYLAANESYPNASALTNLADLYARGDRYTEAVAVSSEALSIDPSNHLALAVRGYAYYQQGLSDSAFCDLDLALELDSSSAYCYAYRGRIHYDEQRFSEAVEDFMSAADRKDCPKWVVRLMGEALGCLYGGR